VRHPLLQRLEEAGLANPSFPTHQDNLPSPLLHLLPAFEQKSDLGLASDQGSESSDCFDVDATLGGTHSQHAIHSERRRAAFQGGPPQVLTEKVAVDEAIPRLTDDDRIWGSVSLEPRCHVRRAPQGKLRMLPADIPDHREARMN